MFGFSHTLGKYRMGVKPDTLLKRKKVNKETKKKNYAGQVIS